MKRLISIIVLMVLVTGCSDMLTKGYNQKPKDELSPKSVFKREDGLKLYTKRMYKFLPKATGITHGDAMSDYTSRKNVPTFLEPGAYDAKTAGGWNWSNLRTINYFIVNAPKEARKAGIDENTIDKYLGIARFFRAHFYFKKVKRFGNVPWYSKPLSVKDSAALFKTQDPRTLVMDSVLADLDYSIAHLADVKDNSASAITKWVALAYKSRVCLFAGTYRKYHPNLGLQSSAKEWLKEAAKSANKLMKSGTYKLHVDQTNPKLSYRELFTTRNDHPPSDETILSFNVSADFGLIHDANWWYTSPTYGDRLSLQKKFVNTYLDIDGTRFTDKSNYKTMPFGRETKNRDWRLQQTIRTPGYKRADGTPVAPNFSYTMTGYQPIKFSLDIKRFDDFRSNDNSIPIIRYAEVLLNYAEAKAELGTFTQSDWDRTIKLLRQRAGIKNTSMPAKADPYLQKNFFPNISDPVLLEIRRERGIELALEGFRFDDLRRWNRGKLLEKPYMGMYVSKLNTPFDLNQDGNSDVEFVKSTPSNKTPGIIYINVGGSTDFSLSQGNKGNILWLANKPKVWKDYKNLYPIPFHAIVVNPNLKQNPGWKIQ